MSGKQIYGLGEFIPGPDFKVNGTSEGGASASQSFTVLKADWLGLVQGGVFSRGVTATSLDPNAQSRGGDALYLDRTETTDQREGWLKVTVFYAGWSAEYQEGERDEEPTYAKRSVLVQRTILEHPEVAALAIADRLLCASTLDGVYTWDSGASKLQVRVVESDGSETFKEATTQPTAGAGVTWVSKIAQGTTSYDASYTTWEKTWSDDVGIPQAQQDLQGKVVQTVPGNPYTPATHDWRLDEVSEAQIGVVSGQSGGLYRNRLLFVLSVPGGWDAEIYDY